MLQNQHFKCQHQRLRQRWARVHGVLQGGLTVECKAITHHLVPVMAPQLLWHSLSPVILGHRLFFSLSAVICSQRNCDSLRVLHRLISFSYKFLLFRLLGTRTMTIRVELDSGPDEDSYPSKLGLNHDKARKISPKLSFTNWSEI